ncbi:MAG TPA: hypothetical protein VIL45_04565 [Thermoplasmata archaeon]|nr:hypothetical protein [Thermoplasmata archaeon]
MVKRYVMLQLWRVQQSYVLLSLLLWGLVITFTAYPVVGSVWLGFLEDRFGISPSTPGIVAATLVLIFLSAFGFLFTLGVIYDKYLRLWREQLDVAYERNPYTREKLMVKEILLWRHMFLPALRRVAAEDPEIQREIEFMKKWIEKSESMDGNIRRAVGETEEWVRRGESGGT